MPDNIRPEWLFFMFILAGIVVVWLRDGPDDQRVAGSIPETTDFLTNRSGQATKALVSLFTKQ